MPRLRREVRQHRHRGRNLAVAGKMMLNHEELPEAQAVGLDHILDEAVITLAVLETGAAFGPGAAEQSELHVPSLRFSSIIRTPEKKTLGNPRCSGADYAP